MSNLRMIWISRSIEGAENHVPFTLRNGNNLKKFTSLPQRMCLQTEFILPKDTQTGPLPKLVRQERTEALWAKGKQVAEQNKFLSHLLPIVEE